MKKLIQRITQKIDIHLFELQEVIKFYRVASTNLTIIGFLPKLLVPTVPGHAGTATNISFTVVYLHFYFPSQLESGCVNVCKAEIRC